MASLNIRRLDDEVLRWLEAQAREESVSVEEVVRRILREACAENTEKPMGTAIREIFAGNGADLEIPPREPLDRVDFSGPEYGPADE